MAIDEPALDPIVAAMLRQLGVSDTISSVEPSSTSNSLSMESTSPTAESRRLRLAVSGRPSRRRTRLMNWANSTPSTSGTCSRTRWHISHAQHTVRVRGRTHHRFSVRARWPGLAEEDELDDRLVRGWCRHEPVRTVRPGSVARIGKLRWRNRRISVLEDGSEFFNLFTYPKRQQTSRVWCEHVVSQEHCASMCME